MPSVFVLRENRSYLRPTGNPGLAQLPARGPRHPGMWSVPLGGGVVGRWPRCMRGGVGWDEVGGPGSRCASPAPPRTPVLYFHPNRSLWQGSQGHFCAASGLRAGQRVPHCPREPRHPRGGGAQHHSGVVSWGTHSGRTLSNPAQSTQSVSPIDRPRARPCSQS